MMLFADDGEALIQAAFLREYITIMLAFYDVCAVPIKWSKIRGGVEIQCCDSRWHIKSTE